MSVDIVFDNTSARMSPRLGRGIAVCGWNRETRGNHPIRGPHRGARGYRVRWGARRRSKSQLGGELSLTVYDGLAPTVRPAT
jgi:hypothetical protein